MRSWAVLIIVLLLALVLVQGERRRPVPRRPLPGWRPVDPPPERKTPT